MIIIIHLRFIGCIRMCSEVQTAQTVLPTKRETIQFMAPLRSLCLSWLLSYQTAARCPPAVEGLRWRAASSRLRATALTEAWLCWGEG